MPVNLTLTLTYGNDVETLWNIDVADLLSVVDELGGEVHQTWRTDDQAVRVDVRVASDDTPTTPGLPHPAD